MATAIRLKRGGRTHSAYYRIVVMDSRTRNQGREVEILGYHHPCARPEPVSQVDAIRALEWLRKGAQPSETVKSVFSKLGVMKHFHDGTAPESETVVLKGAAVEDKGFNPAPKPVEKPAPKAEAPEAPEMAQVPEASETTEAAVESAPESDGAAEETE